MRGLPFSVTIEDIRSFFFEYGMVEGSIKIGEDHDRRRTGEGALLFKNREEAERAMNEKQGHNIGESL